MGALFSVLGVISFLGLFVAPIVVLVKNRGQKGKFKKILKVEGILLVLFIVGMALSPVDKEAQLKAQQEKQARIEAQAQADKVKAEEKAKAEAEKARLASLTEEQRQAEAKAKAEAEAKAKEQARIEAEKKAEADRIAQENAKKIAEATAKQEAFNKWVDGQFSPWDGSCNALVSLVKEHMNDPSSFKHAKTTYKVDNLKGFTVYMDFRGTNAFGGVVLNSVTAYADYEKQTITTSN
jgi:flagellar biosynthesis GTPase FlhF